MELAFVFDVGPNLQQILGSAVVLFFIVGLIWASKSGS